MEIHALLTAQTASAPKPTANPADANGAADFAATLKDAEAALEVPPEGELSLGEPPETVVPQPSPSSEPIPPGDYGMALAVMAMPVLGPHGMEGVDGLAESLSTVGVVPLEIQTAVDPAKPTKLPEAPVPMEIAVEVFDVEPIDVQPIDVRPINVPPAIEPSSEAEAEIVATVMAEADSTDQDEASEDAPPDQPSTARPEPRSTETRSESRLEVGPLRKADAVRPEVRLDTYNVVRELANRIEMMAAVKSQQGVIVHLQPLDLGSITLLVKPESGGVSAQISASNDQVRQALEQSQPNLARQLEQRGLTVTSVSVSAETTNRDPQRQPHQQQAFDSRQFQHHPSHNRSPVYGSPDPVARRVRPMATGVDLWI